jgi:hypothetical protein
MFQHNPQRELDIDNIHIYLKTIIERAREHNELCLKHIVMGKGMNDKVALKHAEIRDDYLNEYYLITGISVDYSDL